jgi:CO/xanthine dehydrogenase Mo-binding subunit
LTWSRPWLKLRTGRAVPVEAQNSSIGPRQRPRNRLSPRNNGYAALVAEVDVDLTSGHVHAKKFVVAIDAGPVSNSDGLRNQTEGGILQGLSRALGERVTWDSKKVTSFDWETYNSLYLDLAAPKIEVLLVNRTNVPALGAGETAITLVAAAMGNAIFDATGVRLREAPFTAEHVRAALQAPASQEKAS